MATVMYDFAMQQLSFAVQRSEHESFFDTIAKAV
jgi:hypothetical protein